MGRLVDADKFEAFVIHTNGDEEFVNGVQYVLERIDNAPTIEAIPKAEYEQRLKADMVAMLTELQLEIEDKAIRKKGIDSGFEYNYEFISSEKVIEIIQQKINALKENNHD